MLPHAWHPAVVNLALRRSIQQPKGSFGARCKTYKLTWHTHLSSMKKGLQETASQVTEPTPTGIRYTSLWYMHLFNAASARCGILMHIICNKNSMWSRMIHDHDSSNCCLHGLCYFEQCRAHRAPNSAFFGRFISSGRVAILVATRRRQWCTFRMPKAASSLLEERGHMRSRAYASDVSAKPDIVFWAVSGLCATRDRLIGNGALATTF